MVLDDEEEAPANYLEPYRTDRRLALFQADPNFLRTVTWNIKKSHKVGKGRSLLRLRASLGLPK
jgi:hypothetical protein